MITSQLTIEELGTPLSEVTFVVLDLETTGGSPQDAGITEIGAVKVRAGKVTGEFHTLTNPGEPIPAFIASLTGISNAMVASAPTVASVLPTLMDFLRGCVFVAHNAPYDAGFLKGACAKHGVSWPAPRILDTAALARQVLQRDEVPNRKLGTLAAFFGSPTTPNHRALDDARATVDVMHGLIERVGNLGVSSVEELLGYSGRVPETLRRKRTLADGLPDAPGVYIFEDSQGRALYVGTSRNLRSRVRTYFTASEKRTRMAEMVALAHQVTPIVCATPLEASVRELRVIAERKPPYNRRSTYPERSVWLKLTTERFPRLSITSKVLADSSGGAEYIGPFSNRKQAESAAEAITSAVGLRTCSDRMGAAPVRESPCIQAHVGRCLAPCTGGVSAEDYAVEASRAREAMRRDSGAVVNAAAARMGVLAEQERFEDAADCRERLAAYLRGADRAQRSRMLAENPQVIAAAPREDHSWEIHVIRYGRLASACLAPPGCDPLPYVEAAASTAESVEPAPAPASAALPEETRLVLSWLEGPGVRLVDVATPLSLPIGAAAASLGPLDAARAARQRIAYGNDGS